MTNGVHTEPLGDPEPEPDKEHPPAATSGGSPLGPTSRRTFLGLMAGAGATLVAGCTRLSSANEQPPPASNPGTTLARPPMGPEPSVFAGHSPQTKMPTGLSPRPLEADICVVGGGAAGVAAATAAARSGADTILIEESNVLGGNVTRGLVNLDKIAWGGGPMVAGFFQELIGELEARGQAVYPSPDTHYAVPFEPDGLRHLALVTCRQAGADVRLGTTAIGVEKEPGEERRIGILWALEQGHLVQIRARVFIDCTGDGHLGHLAGCSYGLGDRAHGQIQGQTLIFYVAPVDYDAIDAYAKDEGENLTNGYQIIGLGPFMAGFRKEYQGPGDPQRGMLINRNMQHSMVSISASEIYGNHLEPGALAMITQALQEQNRQIHARLRRELPGFEDSRIVRMAERPYLREGRRLTGYYQLTAEDVLGATKPVDSIARGWYPIDLHVSYAGGPIHWGSVPVGDWYGIPYRCLVSRDLDNLLMAGRCISVTHEALGSTRVSPLSMALGQAAGVAAGFAAARGARPADLESGVVQEELRRQGALL